LAVGRFFLFIHGASRYRLIAVQVSFFPVMTWQNLPFMVKAQLAETFFSKLFAAIRSSRGFYVAFFFQDPTLMNLSLAWVLRLSVGRNSQDDSSFSWHYFRTSPPFSKQEQRVFEFAPFCNCRHRLTKAVVFSLKTPKKGVRPPTDLDRRLGSNFLPFFWVGSKKPRFPDGAEALCWHEASPPPPANCPDQMALFQNRSFFS